LKGEREKMLFSFVCVFCTRRTNRAEADRGRGRGKFHDLRVSGLSRSGLEMKRRKRRGRFRPRRPPMTWRGGREEGEGRGSLCALTLFPDSLRNGAPRQGKECSYLQPSANNGEENGKKRRKRGKVIACICLDVVGPYRKKEERNTDGDPGSACACALRIETREEKKESALHPPPFLSPSSQTDRVEGGGGGKNGAILVYYLRFSFPFAYLHVRKGERRETCVIFYCDEPAVSAPGPGKKGGRREGGEGADRALLGSKRLSLL